MKSKSFPSCHLRSFTVLIHDDFKIFYYYFLNRQIFCSLLNIKVEANNKIKYLSDSSADCVYGKFNLNVKKYTNVHTQDYTEEVFTYVVLASIHKNRNLHEHLRSIH